MNKKRYLLAVGAIEEDQFLRLTLSKYQIILILSSVVLICSVLGFGLGSLVHVFRMGASQVVLKNENELLHKNLERFDQKLKRVQHSLRILEARNDQIRTTAGLKPLEQVPQTAFLLSSLDVRRPKDETLEWNLLGLIHDIAATNENMLELEKIITTHRQQIAHYPSIRPVVGGWVSSGCGERLDPFTGENEDHPGIDIAIKPGSEVYAAAAGVVKTANLNYIKNKGYGKHIIIDHGFGYETLYGHLSEIYVKQGQKIKRWDLIGLSGNTGKSTAPHIHYGVAYNGETRDPMHFLLQ